MRKINIKLLAFDIFVAEAIGVISGFVANIIGSGFQEQYINLIKPSFSPPGWIFPIAWLILYALMGTAYYMYKNNEGFKINNGGAYYKAQLFFNFMWSILYFGLNFKFVSFIWIIALLLLIIKTTIQFYKVNKVSGMLMFLYIAWVSFASYLNFATWYLNK